MSGPTRGDQAPPFGGSARSASKATKATVNFGRLVIAGGPSAGKSTAAAHLSVMSGVGVLASDDLIGSFSWSEASAEVATWFDRLGPWIIEGVAAARALRKWLAAHHDGKPCDFVLYMPDSVEPIAGRVLGMSKGCAKVFDEIRDELAARGVKIGSQNAEIFAERLDATNPRGWTQ